MLLIYYSVNIIDKGTISSAFRTNQISPLESNKVIKNTSNNNDNNLSSITVYSSTNILENNDFTGPNHLKIIPVSGVIFKKVGNQKTGNENYKNKNGRMTYKEYILLRKKYMGDEIKNKAQNNTMYNVYPKNEEEEKQPKTIKNEDKLNKVRSKSKSDKIRNYYLSTRDNQETKVEEFKGFKALYETNLDENGKEVLNENLFRNRQIENKTMRKTFTGKFLPNRGNSKKDAKRETFYNFDNKYNINKGLDSNNNKAYKSYYGGFRKKNEKNI